MSHHFDTERAQEEPSLNICDMYVFPGKTPASVVMAMTLNSDSGLSASDTLPAEGLYVFRVDTDGDATENVVFKFRFDEPQHVDGDGHHHVQTFRVIRAQGDQISGEAGDVLVEGKTGSVTQKTNIRAFAGIAPDLWAADAVAFFHFLTAFYAEGRFNGDAFLNKKNFFEKRNVMALVLEVPIDFIGKGKIGVWATASLYGHAPEVQISRWGLPLLTHLFLSNPTAGLAVKYHASHPNRDREQFQQPIADFTAKMVACAGSIDSPNDYAKALAERLCPAMLPYELGSEAAFTLDHFNGRPLHVDAYDIMLSLATNRPIHDGASPNLSKIRSEFPYYGERFSKEDQSGMQAISRSFYRS